MRAEKHWLTWVIQFGVIVVLTLPLAICFQLVGMLLTGWGIQGFGWLAVGVLVLPTALAWSWMLWETRDVKRAIVQGTVLGVVASVVLLLTGLAMVLAAGAMDGGI